MASGSIIKDGTYDNNDMYWKILLIQMASCAQSNLKDCRLKVGGGYDFARWWSENGLSSFDVLSDPSDLDTRSSKSIRLPFTTGLLGNRNENRHNQVGGVRWTMVMVPEV